MPTVNFLSDVEPTVLTLCKQGANRQRIFLKKEQADEGLHVLPGGGSLIRKADGSDWSYFYCVVAEPGKREDAGVGDGAGSGVEDQWRDPEEIRKAAHYFAKSDKLITGLHDTVEPYGTLVENAVALADFEVLDPSGVKQVIRKGSWYVGIEPTAAGRKAIDDGSFTGLSLEGTGVREPVELAKSEDEKRTIWNKLGEALGLTPAESLRKGSDTLTNDTSGEEKTVADTDKNTEKLSSDVEELKKSTGAATTAITGALRHRQGPGRAHRPQGEEEGRGSRPHGGRPQEVDGRADHHVRATSWTSSTTAHRQDRGPRVRAGKDPRQPQEVRRVLRARGHPRGGHDDPARSTRQGHRHHDGRGHRPPRPSAGSSLPAQAEGKDRPRHGNPPGDPHGVERHLQQDRHRQPHHPCGDGERRRRVPRGRDVR